MMPGQPYLSSEESIKIVEYILGMDKSEVVTSELNQTEPYKHTGYKKFLDDKGLPAISPPWGTLTAIDLNRGEHLWQIPLGDTPGLHEDGATPTGCENYGGPLITQNGLLIIAATKDGMIRGYDRHNARLLWEYKLPAPAFATPSTYFWKGKQYIVIACGGEKLGTPKSNQIIAFSLPDHEIQ